MHFVSAPDLKPPKVSADRKTMYRSIRPGYFLLTTDGAEILDTHLHPVWFRPGLIQDLKQQSYEGKPVLTWWQGTLTSNGAGDGSIYVADEHYRVVATLNPATGWSIDSHEAVIHGHDIWVTSIRTLTKGRFGRSSRAKRRPLLDDAVQEYDLRNGRLLRSWDVFNPGRKPHVPLSESDLRQPDVPDEQNFPWDPYHVN